MLYNSYPSQQQVILLQINLFGCRIQACLLEIWAYQEMVNYLFNLPQEALLLYLMIVKLKEQ